MRRDIYEETPVATTSPHSWLSRAWSEARRLCGLQFQTRLRNTLGSVSAWIKGLSLSGVQAVPPSVNQGIHTGKPSEDRQPAIVIAWSPECVTAEEYTRLVSLMGDLVRAEGGVGVTRIK